MASQTDSKRGRGRPRQSEGGQGNPQIRTRVRAEIAAWVATKSQTWLHDLVEREHRQLDLVKAAEECLAGVSGRAILEAGDAALLAAHGYLAIIADAYECAPPTRAEAEEFLKLLQA